MFKGSEEVKQVDMRRRGISGSGRSEGKDPNVGTAHVTKPQLQRGGRDRVRARGGGRI